LLQMIYRCTKTVSPTPILSLPYWWQSIPSIPQPSQHQQAFQATLAHTQQGTGEL